MLIDVHPATTMLRGDGRGYNPREIVVTPLSDGEELLTGAFVDDGPGHGHHARRPERPFWITTHWGFEAWSDLNARVFRELEHGPRDVMIACRSKTQHVLVCPTCRALVPVRLHSVVGHGHLPGAERAGCLGCGRGFTPAEIDERGTWL